ncbi:MAG: ClbS/DfsB family four-helix bundle protein [Chitinophagales bacterium]
MNQVLYEKWPLGKMIQLNTSSPFQKATIRIQKWKKADSAPTKS